MRRYALIACLLGVLAGRFDRAIAEDEPASPAYLHRAQGVEPALLESDNLVRVVRSEEAWSFLPAGHPRQAALLFFPGGRVEPIAYAPLARALAEHGYRVDLVNQTSSSLSVAVQKSEGIARASAIRDGAPGVVHWVVGGHSLGAAIAAQCVHEEPNAFAGLVLIATTHPRDFDLSKYGGSVTKVVGTLDPIASLDKVERNRELLPGTTRLVRVEGGNHAQFGSYGPQMGDREATIGREEQQALTLEAILLTLQAANPEPEAENDQADPPLPDRVEKPIP